MSKFLYRLGSWSYRTVWPFLAFWLIVLVAMVGLTAGFAKTPNPNFAMPEMDSTTTQEEMMEHFDQDTDAMSAPEGTVVIQALWARGWAMMPLPGTSTSCSKISRTPVP